MNRSTLAVIGLLLAVPARAQEPKTSPLTGVIDQVNQRLVKLYGSGGFRGLASYGTGVVISPDGYVLTVASPLLDTQELLVHLADGRRMIAKVGVVEPELDLALLKIENVEDLPHFDLAAAGQKPLAEPGTRVLAFSNQFQIATRDEPMSIMQGVIAAYSKLLGRRGVHEAPYTGDVYVLDAITNNPGAAGGALTTRKGELLGLIGKELQNSLTDTWINYAIPLQAKVEVRRGQEVTGLSLLEFVDKARKGEYKPIVRDKSLDGTGGYHGIVLVPDVVERTPPFVEEVLPASPAAKAGLKPDDLVVYVDGVRVVSIKEFRDIVDKARPGALLKLEVRRGDRLTSVDLKLEQPVARGRPRNP
jgi:serine protease Do